MWAPGAYKDAGRETLPAPNIGIENYFFEVADTILSHIRSSRNTAILPQRVGPIADTLYSAAGNSSDEGYYKRGIIGYSFEAGAQRITVNETTGAISRTAVGFQPCFAGPGTNGGQGATCTTGNPPVPNPLMVNEGHDSTMEFAEGNFGMIQGALEYHEDVTAPTTTIEYSAAADRAATRSTSGSTGSTSPRSSTTRPTAPIRSSCPDDKTTEINESCANTSATGTRCYNNQGPRMPGEVLTLRPRRPHGQVDGGGHQGQPRGRQVAAAPGRRGRRRRHRRAATSRRRSVSRSAPRPPSGRSPRACRRTTRPARRPTSSRRPATRRCPSPTRSGQPGPPDERHVQPAAAAPGDRVEPGRHGRRRWHGRRPRADSPSELQRHRSPTTR